MSSYKVYDASNLITVNDIFINRKSVKSQNYCLNSILAINFNNVINVKTLQNKSSLTLSTNNGKFAISSKFANLSANGRTVTIQGTKAQINKALASLSVRSDANFIKSAKKNSIACTIKVALKAGKNTQNEQVHIYVENSSASVFSLTKKNYGYINSVNSLSKSNFRYNNYSNSKIIDAEKSYFNLHGDSSLCWAATAANMLTWTGYGSIGLKNKKIAVKKNENLEDAVFRQFWSNFNNDGSFAGDGIQWFMTGKYSAVNTAKPVKKAPAFKGYVGYQPKYFTSAGDYSWDSSTKTITKLNKLAKSVFAGDAVGLGIYQADGSFGHAITCWGISFDASRSKTDPKWLTGFYVTDSDSDDYLKKPKDTLTHIKVHWTGQKLGYKLTNYSNGYYWNGSYTSLARINSLKVKKYKKAINLAVVSRGLKVINYVVPAFENQKVYAGGITSHTKVSEYGRQYVYAGGLAISSVVSSAAYQYVYGTVKNTVIVGSQYVSKGGLAINTKVSSFGKQNVENKGIASNTTLNTWTDQYISSGGLAINTKLMGSYAWQTVYKGGRAVSTCISSGARQYLSSGIASRSVVYSSGSMYVDGGKAYNLNLKKGAILTVYSGSLGGSNTAQQAQITVYSKFIVSKNASLTFGAKNTVHNQALQTSGNLIFTGTNNTINSLQLSAQSNVKYNLKNIVPNISNVMCNLSTANTQNIGNFEITVKKAQRIGDYGLSKNIKHSNNGIHYSVKLDDNTIGTLQVNGSTLTKNGVNYSLTSHNNQIDLRVSVNFGIMDVGTSSNDILEGTNQSDIFFGGEGDDTIRCYNGRDVAIYDSTFWGQDKILSTSGTVTLLFSDLDANAISKKTNGKNLVITKTNDDNQQITIENYNPSTHNIVYTSNLSEFNTYLNQVRSNLDPDVNLTDVRDNVWKSAGLALNSKNS